MESHVFDGSDPISVLSFLARFKQQMDQNKLSEGAACIICPNFFAGDAKEAYESNFELPNDEGGFNSWPEAVQYPLKSYAKDRHIEAALAVLDDISQKADEKQGAYGRRLRTQARRCGSVFSEAELITRFIRGLHGDLMPLLRLLRADLALPNAFQDYVDRAAVQGDAQRALTARGKKPPRKSVSPGRAHQTPTRLLGSLRPSAPVFEVEAGGNPTDDMPYMPPPRADSTADPVMVAHPDPRWAPPVPTKQLESSPPGVPSEADQWTDDVYAVIPYYNPRIPPYAQPTLLQRPGWIVHRNDPSEICFECFALGHKKQNCPHLAKTFYDANYSEMVNRNYHKLTREQKEYLQAVGRTPTIALVPPPLGAHPPSVPPTEAGSTHSQDWASLRRGPPGSPKVSFAPRAKRPPSPANTRRGAIARVGRATSRAPSAPLRRLRHSDSDGQSVHCQSCGTSLGRSPYLHDV